MKSIGSIVVWVIALLVLAVAAWGITLYAGWPLWMAVALFAGAIGAWFLVRYLRRLAVMMRSRSKLAAQVRAARGEAAAAAGSPETQLVRKWKAAVATLRNSNLRRQGNPLYVLPWFMVIGRSGTGKTTALTRARLSSPIQKVSQAGEIAQTANCDWWYFDRAVVIDCAGRYVDAQDDAQDRREWELGLDLLGRYRPQEGLDGLVLAVSADRLTTPDPDAMIEEGRVARARIEQLIRMFGKRFPVYVLVTKCDRLYGFEAWAHALPAHALDQAMGYLADEAAEGTPAQFVERAFASIGARLEKLRLALVARQTSVPPELLLFPGELDSLRPGLQAFVDACLADNPYFERPFLRGVFFSSGLQAGGAVSALLGEGVPPVPPHAGASAGLFLHDFFDRILPQDRRIARPAMLVNPWRRVTRHTGLAACWLLLAALGIAMTLSFVGNMRTIELVRETLPGQLAFTGRLDQDAATLARLSDTLIEVERNNRSWLSRWVGAGTGDEALQARLKARFVSDYRARILPTLDQNEAGDIQRAAAGGTTLPEVALDIVRSINLLKARRNGADRFALEAMRQPLPSSHYDAQLNQQLAELASAYLAWSAPDDRRLAERLDMENALLSNISDADPQMTWLASLVTDTGTNAPVRGIDFWSAATATSVAVSSGEPVATDGAYVSAVYTGAGRKTIDGYLEEVRDATGDEARFDAGRAAFEHWYQDRRVMVWRKFVNDFLAMPKPLSNEADWRAAMGQMTSARSPYFEVIRRVAEEFQGEADESLPWLGFTRRFTSMLDQASGLGSAGKLMGPVAKWAGAINATGGAALRQTLGGEPQQGGQTIRTEVAAVDSLREYLGALGQIGAASVAGSGKAYQLAVDFHQASADPAARPSPVQAMMQTFARLRSLTGDDDASTEAIWRLAQAPSDFLLRYIEQQASCELQKDWQADVLWPLQTVTGDAATNDQLFGAKGSVWTFADGPAKPFLVRGATRYGVVQTTGYSMPFTEAFLPMLNGAVDQRVALLVNAQRSAAQQQSDQLQAQQSQLQWQQELQRIDAALAAAKAKADAASAQSLPLTVSAQPTGVNPDANARPFATILSIQCAAGAQVLNNYNFPVSSSFVWVPNQCSDTTLQIKIGDLVLTRKYTGQLGFAGFMTDFRDGVHAFVPNDFPSQRSALAALGVTQLTVRYNFDGLSAALGAADDIGAYAALQKSSEARRQQIKDAQFQQQQQDLAQKIAAQGAGFAVPLPASLAPADPGTPAVPPTIGQCWATDADATERRVRPDVSAMIRRLVRAAGQEQNAIPSPLPPRPPLPPGLQMSAGPVAGP
ncbi:type VI secretion system protein ImpL [Paraburkholderia caballeronis]|uniref:type VI secretion protein IcmF/TssM N-terminal domain-containing protein n=1 Tax=Paraburkholderia caballeronis TaxID=416943 RepID=UPI001065B12C|nr:type VI secretion protein IcmF/TssM N-terminal domain-containing protein [Paraburkholderia caballeronis]TDV28723.1 type VI secretion system protein ImpL [Paraburkholderia caballeronis]